MLRLRKYGENRVWSKTKTLIFHERLEISKFRLHQRISRDELHENGLFTRLLSVFQCRDRQKGLHHVFAICRRSSNVASDFLAPNESTGWQWLAVKKWRKSPHKFLRYKQLCGEQVQTFKFGWLQVPSPGSGNCKYLPACLGDCKYLPHVLVNAEGNLG